MEIQALGQQPHPCPVDDLAQERADDGLRCRVEIVIRDPVEHFPAPNPAHERRRQVNRTPCKQRVLCDGVVVVVVVVVDVFTLKNHPGFVSIQYLPLSQHQSLHSSCLTQHGQFPWSQANLPKKGILRNKKDPEGQQSDFRIQAEKKIGNVVVRWFRY